MPGIFENRDCMEAMAEMPDKAFELAIVDPPYGIGYSMRAAARSGKREGNGKARNTTYASYDWDKDRPMETYFANIMRVSANQVIFGGNYFSDMLPPSRCWLVWDKDNGETDFADFEMAWTSFKGSARFIKYQWNGMLQQSMKNREKRIHPTQKPAGLYREILRRFAKPGWRILDTHVGSGSSLIACEELGFQYAGYEINKEYFEKASARLKSAQMGLFSGAV